MDPTPALDSSDADNALLAIPPERLLESLPPTPSSASNDAIQSKQPGDRTLSSSSRDKSSALVNIIKFDTRTLDAVLGRIESKIEEHDSELDKVHSLEKSVETFRKFTILHKLMAGSHERYKVVASSEGDDVVEEVVTEVHDKPAETRGRTASSLARGMTKDIEEVMKKEGEVGRKKAHARGSSRGAVDDEQNEQILQTKRELVGLRTIVRQLQGEQDKDAASLLNYDHRLGSMKVELMKCKKALASTFSKKDWAKLDKEVEDHVEGMKKYMDKWSAKQVETLKEENEGNLSKLEAWFEEHDEMAKKRQVALDKKVKSCARSNELEELRENLEADQGVLKDGVARAVRQLRDAMDNFDNMTQKTTLRRLDKVFVGLIMSWVHSAFGKWKEMNEMVNEEQRELERKGGIMKKAVMMARSRTLALGMKLWLKKNQMMIDARNEKIRCMKLMTRVMTRFLLSTQDAGFKHWHRATMLVREEQMREQLKREQEDLRRKSLSLGKKFTMDKTSHLGEIMNTFGNDTKGALDVLTREVINLRVDEIGGLKRAWELEKVRSKHDSQQTLKSSLDTIAARAEEFEADISAKLGTMETVMPVVRGELNAVMRKSDLIEGDLKKAGDMGKKNNRDINSLFDAQGRMDGTMVGVEEKMATVKGDIVKLKEGDVENKKLIENLQHRLDDSEERERGLTRQLDDTIKYFEAELGSMRKLIETQGSQLEEVESTALREKNYARDMELRLDTEDRDIRGMVEFLGVVKPKVDLMVDICIPFERLSFEKKYCPPINSSLLESNIPDTIAGFGVRMAEWIAFKADSEALSKVVAGVNPDEIVYADEDIEIRRRFLLDEIRAEFRSLVESASPEAGALRLEARHKFTARLIDTIDSALSKHDQVLVTGSSRASRIKAAVPSCVACDRPLRMKARKGKLMEEEGGANGPQQENEMNNVNSNLQRQQGNEGFRGKGGGNRKRPQSADPSMRRDPSSGGFVGGASGRGGEEESQGYIMRAGFKMPRSQKLRPMGEMPETVKGVWSSGEVVGGEGAGDMFNTVGYSGGGGGG